MGRGRWIARAQSGAGPPRPAHRLFVLAVRLSRPADDDPAIRAGRAPDLPAPLRPRSAADGAARPNASPGGVVRPRIMPWPEGAEWALNVRHDFDRAQSRGQVKRVLAAHAAAGTAATWYWRSRHVKARAAVDRLRSRGSDGAAVARPVAAPRQEVTLHTELPWSRRRGERRAIERATGKPALGTSAHGAPDCFRWQGAPNVLWADRHGFDYTEFISHAHLHPHRFAALRSDGTIEPAPRDLPPHHDRSTVRPPRRCQLRIGARRRRVISAGRGIDASAQPSRSQPRRADRPAPSPAHRGPARLDRGGGGRSGGAAPICSPNSVWTRRGWLGHARSLRGVRGAVLELLHPDGDRRGYALHVESGGSVVSAESPGGASAAP